MDAGQTMPRTKVTASEWTESNVGGANTKPMHARPSNGLPIPAYSPTGTENNEWETPLSDTAVFALSKPIGSNTLQNQLRDLEAAESPTRATPSAVTDIHAVDCEKHENYKGAKFEAG